MWLRWLALLGCLCVLVTPGQTATVPTAGPAVAPETMVVARSEEEEYTTIAYSPSSTDSVNAEAEETTDGPTPAIKLSEMAVRSEVSLRYAHTAIVTKMRNPAKKAQEATFRVLLPETAFISGFVMILDGKPYKAYVKEKEEAKQIYSDAVNAGIGAAHIAAKARDSNHFTVTVNVEPRTTAVFNLTYEELLVRRNKVYNHAINLHPGALVPKLTVTVHIQEAQKITELRVPEIRTGNEVDATEDDAQNSKAVISRGHDDREATITFSPDLDEQKRLMEIYVDKTKESRSHSHSAGYWRSPDEAPAPPEGVLGQFVVQYDVARPKEGEILVNDGYFVHFFAPADLPPLLKHVVFVLDTSGSMMDRKITQLREAMRTILSELNPGDYFSIVEFATSVKVYDLKEADEEPKKPQYGYYSWDERPTTLVPPFPATPENIARAKTIVGRLDANGGTNIASALNIAVDLINKGVGWKLQPATPKPASNDAPHAEPLAELTTIADTTAASPTTEVAKQDDGKKLEPIIIFLTDGDPTVGETDTVRIINRLVEKNYGENKAAIFSLAFGEDADRTFLRKLSLRNDGFMRHIYEAADAALQLRDFYRQVSSPLLADVHFNYPKEQIKEGSLTKNKFRAYYAGSETVVAGRVADRATEIAPSVIGVCGVDDNFTKRKKYEIFPKVPVSRTPGQYLPLERLWAFLTVKQLLDERDAADTPQDKDKEDSPEQKALQLALKYEFVTPLTSLVVVKPNATKAVDAESVDKLTPFGGMPLAALSGAPGQPAPQFAYKAALHSAIGHVSSPQLASFSHAAAVPLLDAAPYEESEDYEGPAPGSSRVRSRTKSKGPFLRLDSSSGERYKLARKLGPYFKEETYSSGTNSGDSAMPAPSFFRTQSQTIPRRVMYYNKLGYSAYPSQIQKWSSSSESDDRSGLLNSFDAVDSVLPESLTTAFQYPPLPAVSTTPRPPPAPVDLRSLHLQEYAWVRDALAPGKELLEFDLINNGTVSHFQLELTKDVAAAKENIDAECIRNTEGAAGGVCVYLTRCEAAKNITLDQYKTSFCPVNVKFAGVCCPRDKVDVDATKS